MPNAPLTINYCNILDVQNTQDILTIGISNIFQKDDLSLSPLTLARYFLYNRTKGPEQQYGLNDFSYLNYQGGFITCGDKVNSKYSDLHVEKNLLVALSSNFYSGINMTNNSEKNTARITRLNRLDSITSLTNKNHDDEVLAVGDFKRFSYYPGSIVMWSGSYSDLQTYLPLWRLCAPPDAGIDSSSGLNVPNLQGKFIMGGSYTPYTATNNRSPFTSFGPATTINSQGGSDFVQIQPNQLEPHNHQNFLTFGGGYVDMWAEDEAGTRVSMTFYQAGGDLKNRTPQITHSGGAGASISSGNAANVGPWTTYADATRSPFERTIYTITPDPIVFTRPSAGFEDRGGSLVHENRPPFYALAYIIYVGTRR